MPVAGICVADRCNKADRLVMSDLAAANPGPVAIDLAARVSRDIQCKLDRAPG